MPNTFWQPTASITLMAARARLNQTLRNFFHKRAVLEVETPLLSHTTGTDPNLHPITACYASHPAAAATTMYLQTSPEFAMKRLLAAGSGPIFQICKAFRNGESGSRHNPEFTMLEWYRPGFTLQQLMDEVAELLTTALGPLEFTTTSYRQLFLDHLAIDPFSCTDASLTDLVRQTIEVTGDISSRDNLLDLLYSHVIEPQLQQPVFIFNYPASQAALARLTTDELGSQVALRFELVMHGMEIANGYDELVNADEQARRFAADQSVRSGNNMPVYPADQRLIEALAQGMPDCAGVALGVDRLLMLQTGMRQISDVLAFVHERA
ncbi:MAG: EF-P lysine aminoacylase EpmA [Pseudomonadota bacterium]